MLRQASVAEVRRRLVTREQGYVAIVMCHYPRGLATELRDAFLAELAPDRALLTEWKSAERAHGHEAAFRSTDYENRFRLSAWGLHLLRELSERARKEAVHLVCQCEVGERCHREMLLLLARSRFDAAVDEVHHRYPAWERRLVQLPWPLPESALASSERLYPT